MHTLEELVATSIRAARQRLGLTQAELARLATAVGAPWTQSKIAAMETGRRDIGLGEALTLGNLLGIGLHDLVLGDQATSPLSVGGVTVTVEQLGRMLQGSPVLTGGRESADTHVAVMTSALRRRIRSLVDEFDLEHRDNAAEEIEAASHGSAERAATRHVQTSAEVIAAASLALWGRSLTSERRARRRSKATAKELDELREFLRDREPGGRLPAGSIRRSSGRPSRTR